MRWLLLVVAVIAGSLWTCGQEPANQPEIAPAVASKGPLNFDFDGTSAADAFKQVCDAAGMTLKADDQMLFDADPIFLKVANGYFWPTVLEMAKQAKLVVPPFQQSGASELQLQPANRGFGMIDKQPRSDADGFVLVLQHATFSRTVSLQPNSQARANFSINGLLFIDPAKTVVAALPAAVTEAVDDKGNSYVPPDGPQTGAILGGGQSTLIQNYFLPLSGEPRGTKLVSLKGKLRLRVIADQKQIVVDDVSKLPITVTAGDQQIKIEATDDAMFNLTATITGSGQTQQDAWSKIGLIRVTDADGKQLRQTGGSVVGGAFPGGEDKPLVIRASYSGASSSAGPAKRISWRYVLRTEAIEVPFSFSNLPLP